MNAQQEQQSWGAVSEIAFGQFQLVLCPVCADENSHIIDVRSRPGNTPGAEGNPYPGTAAKGAPLVKEDRGALGIVFDGECGHSWELSIQQHKGQNLVSSEPIGSNHLTLEHLRTMPYRAYLKTDHWKAVRAEALKKANFSCQLCRASSPNGRGLNAHHNTYERRGAEEPDDVIVLCKDCHARHHGKLP